MYIIFDSDIAIGMQYIYLLLHRRKKKNVPWHTFEYLIKKYVSKTQDAFLRRTINILTKRTQQESMKMNIFWHHDLMIMMGFMIWSIQQLNHINASYNPVLIYNFIVRLFLGIFIFYNIISFFSCFVLCNIIMIIYT